MKNIKRALAICFALTLLLSFSPAFNVSATDTESESDTPSAYDQLMDNYKLVVSTDFSDPDNTLLTKNQETEKIFIDEDEHLKFLNTTAGKYVNVNHNLGTPSGKIIFEADVCWNTEGLRIGFLSLSDKKALMEFDNGTFRFANISDSVEMTAGQWYTISCAINLDDDVYDAFVDEVQVVSGAEISADVQLKGIRLYVHKNSSENADGDFLLDNVKWYTYHDDHADENKDHACDVDGCSKFMGEHKDADTDHICDYGCAVPIGTCEDTDVDGLCDYGCGKTFGECVDADKDHVCDDGCGEPVGECVDADKDHICDYGCSKTYGECVDADKDHACDYGCSKTYGECVDADKDHACDYGCSKTYGEHADADKDHICDYGCSEPVGECVDADKDHKCDYGCKKFKGACTDFDKDHVCDYGCDKVWGKCEDADGDGICDYGCEKSFEVEKEPVTDDVAPAAGIWAWLLNVLTMIIDIFKNFFSNLF